MKEKRRIFIVTTILIVLITLTGVPKLFINKKTEKLPEVKLKEIEKNETFAIMVPNKNGDGYIPYDGDKWPTDDNDYYYSHSECVDNKGERIENAIVYNEKDNTALLDTSETIYCTLYFDKYPYMKAPIHYVQFGDGVISAPVYMSSKVKQVEFVDYIKDGLNPSDKNTSWWDISDTSQGTPVGSVIAWIEPIQNDENYEILYIGSKTKIRATTLQNAFRVSEYTGAWMSYAVTSLETINFNNRLDTSKTINMGGFISSNSKLKKLEGIENWDTSNVKYMDSFMQYCISIDFSFLKNFDTSSLENIEEAFHGCSNFDDVNLTYISAWNTKNLIYMDVTFAETSISDLSILKNWDVSNVTSTRDMCSRCKNLINVDLSNWHLDKLSKTLSMFSWCSNLQTIDMRNATFTQITDSANYQNMFNDVPSSVIIIVKDQAQKDWIWNNKDGLKFTGEQNQIKLPTDL